MKSAQAIKTYPSSLFPSSTRQYHTPGTFWLFCCWHTNQQATTPCPRASSQSSGVPLALELVGWRVGCEWGWWRVKLHTVTRIGEQGRPGGYVLVLYLLIAHCSVLYCTIQYRWFYIQRAKRWYWSLLRNRDGGSVLGIRDYGEYYDSIIKKVICAIH